MTPYEHFESVYNLKSNMDRFIGRAVTPFRVRYRHLKSNMDRFIADKLKDERIMSANLKSNMDRFIANMFHILSA